MHPFLTVQHMYAEGYEPSTCVDWLTSQGFAKEASLALMLVMQNLVLQRLSEVASLHREINHLLSLFGKPPNLEEP